MQLQLTSNHTSYNKLIISNNTFKFIVKRNTIFGIRKNKLNDIIPVNNEANVQYNRPASISDQKKNQINQIAQINTKKCNK